MRSDIKSYGRTPMDPRMVREIQQSPAMLAEQGGSGQFMSEWGGADQYRVMASMGEPERLTFAAILTDHVTPQEISDVTGLDLGTVTKSASWLEKKGYIAKGTLQTEVAPAEF